jgi:hypothetical protein
VIGVAPITGRVDGSIAATSAGHSQGWAAWISTSWEKCFEEIVTDIGDRSCVISRRMSGPGRRGRRRELR